MKLEKDDFPKCRECNALKETDKHIKDDTGFSWHCTNVGNCNQNCEVTTWDDEGGQWAIFLIKDPDNFGCIQHTYLL